MLLLYSIISHYQEISLQNKSPRLFWWLCFLYYFFYAFPDLSTQNDHKQEYNDQSNNHLGLIIHFGPPIFLKKENCSYLIDVGINYLYSIIYFCQIKLSWIYLCFLYNRLISYYIWHNIIFRMNTSRL